MGWFSLKSWCTPKSLSRTQQNAQQKFSAFEEIKYLKTRDKIKSHNLRSGEVILEICWIQTRFFSMNDLIINFFRSMGIHTEETAFDNRRINFEKQRLSKEEALDKIFYGLKSKPNFTLIDYPISAEKAQEYTQEVIDFFDEPRFYGYESKIYQKSLDLSDLWKSGGFLIVDNEKVGIFWVNDLYDWIEPEFSPLFSSFIG